MKKSLALFLSSIFLNNIAIASDYEAPPKYRQPFGRQTLNLQKQDSSCDTLADLNAILGTHHSSLTECYNYINSTSDYKIAPLKHGQDLFERALLIEQQAKASGYAVWWRFTSNNLEDDMTATTKVADLREYVSNPKMGEKSFAISLLAGYIQDGYTTYGRANFLVENSSACTYIYYANSLFAHTLLERRLTLAQKFAKFIQENGFFSHDAEKVDGLKNMITNLSQRYNQFQEKKEKGELAVYLRDVSTAGEKLDEELKTDGMISKKEYAYLRDLIVNIQNDANYIKEKHSSMVNNLYGERIDLYEGDETKITQAARGNLFAIFLPKHTEERLLQSESNRGVMRGTNAVLAGRGENFHHWMPLDFYIKLKNNVIAVYQDFSLISTEELLEKLKRFS